MKLRRKVKNAFLIVGAASFAAMPLTASASIHTTAEAWHTESRLEYIYNYDGVYEVFARKGYVVDITLKAGEEISGVIAGDTARWMIETAVIGSTPHVFIKPIVDGVTTNFVIYTQSRAYHLLLSEREDYTPIICWNYPENVYPSVEVTPEQEVFNEIFTEQVDGRSVYKALHRDYEFKGSKRADEGLFPLEVFDDGTRTYIKLGKGNKYDLPVLYRVEDKNKGKLALVNYRVRHGYIIADRVFDHARLKYSDREYIDILPKKDDPAKEDKAVKHK